MKMFLREQIDSSMEAHTPMIAEILSIGQKLCQRKHKVGEQLCKEVKRVTQGKARLLLQDAPTVQAEQQGPFSTAVSFPIQFNNRNYGILAITPDVEHTMFPALPLPQAQLLAQVCSLLLYSIELSAFIEGQFKHIDYQTPEQLTRREREVIDLICRGYDRQAIADELDITPTTVDTHQKRIRGKLGVHSEHDIPLAAYQANLFSVLHDENGVPPCS